MPIRMSKDELRKLRLEATPLNFEQLEEDGILVRKSTNWYQLLVPNHEMPEQVRLQISEFKGTSDGKKLVKVKLVMKVDVSIDEAWCRVPQCTVFGAVFMCHKNNFPTSCI